MIKLNCPSKKIFVTLITKTVGRRHDRCFYFPHLTYLVQVLYLGKLSRPRYQQKLNKIMKISQEDVIPIKYLSVKAVRSTESIEWIARQGLVTWKHRQSAKENPKGGYNCPESGSGIDHVRRVVVEHLILSQQDKPKIHRSTLSISYETVILFQVYTEK